MIKIVLLGFLACASAAPKHGCRQHYHQCHGHSYYKYDSNIDDYSDGNNESQMFNIRRLWSELSGQIMKLDTKLTDLSKRFNRNEASPQVDDKEYKIFLELHGFVEKEILIEKKYGLLFIQAIRKVVGEPDREYLNVMTLPDNVGENWSWTYRNGLLKIVFPITQVEKQIPSQTVAPDQSMKWSGVEPYSEEMLNNGQDQNFVVPNGDLVYTNKQGTDTNDIPGNENNIGATFDLNDNMQLASKFRSY